MDKHKLFLNEGGLNTEEYLCNSINALLRDCRTVESLYRGRNEKVRRTISELEPILEKSLRELVVYARSSSQDY